MNTHSFLVSIIKYVHVIVNDGLSMTRKMDEADLEEQQNKAFISEQ